MDDGWALNRVKRSHRQFVQPPKPGVVTVAGHPSDDIGRGTLNSIHKQADPRE